MLIKLIYSPFHVQTAHLGIPTIFLSFIVLFKHCVKPSFTDYRPVMFGNIIMHIVIFSNLIVFYLI